MQFAKQCNYCQRIVKSTDLTTFPEVSSSELRQHQGASRGRGESPEEERKERSWTGSNKETVNLQLDVVYVC